MKHSPAFTRTTNPFVSFARLFLFVLVALVIIVLSFSCTPQAVKEADKKLEQDQVTVRKFQTVAGSNDKEKIRESLSECSDVLRSKSIDVHKLRIENSQLREERDELQADLDDAQTAIWFYSGFWAIVIGAGILGILSVLIKIGLVKIPGMG